MTLKPIQESLARVDQANLDEDWLLDEIRVGKLTNELEYLQQLAAELPSHLYKNINDFKEEARVQYHIADRADLGHVDFDGAVVRRFHAAVLPVDLPAAAGAGQGLARRGRRAVQLSDRLNTHDEMSELADAMNDMTARFQAIRDDLDRQVHERTKQVVRSEQLASVGFLAAGVAHEINNPLASIAMCAESLEEPRSTNCSPPRPTADHAGDSQLSANDPERGLPLQRNHRAAAGFLPHRRRPSARTPICANWCRA